MRYHGGKWRIARWVIGHFPLHDLYVEPFAGAASILMRKPRSRGEIINDLDSEVVNLFRVLRDRVTAAELERLIRLTPFARDEFNAAYEPTEDDPVERARRTVVRSFMGHGSGSHGKHYRHRTGFRAYSQRSYEYDWVNWPDVVPAITARLAGVVVENRPAVRVIERYDGPDTLHYVDPPYVHKTRERVGVYRHEMTDDDHRELAAVLRSADGMVVLSGYPGALYDELYGDWLRAERSALADCASPRTECVWLNPAAAARRPHLGLFGWLTPSSV